MKNMFIYIHICTVVYQSAYVQHICTIILMNKFIFVKRMGQYSASANTAGENLVKAQSYDYYTLLCPSIRPL